MENLFYQLCGSYEILRYKIYIINFSNNKFSAKTVLYEKNKKKGKTNQDKKQFALHNQMIDKKPKYPE